MRYAELRSQEIIQTSDGVLEAIAERFPGSGLSGIACEIHERAGQMDAGIAAIMRPRKTIRVLSAMLTALLVLLALVLLSLFFRMILYNLHAEFRMEEFLQAIDAVISAIVLLGGGLFFVVSAERRQRRKDSLRQLHTLRALAHVIDMHQLKKDPLISRRPAERVPEYLDYCSDLLNIIGKMAAYYEAHIDDSEVREATADVEALTTSLSRKIWQKILSSQLGGRQAK